jgi:hypothetical protein
MNTSYWEASRTPFVSVVMALPLLISYEILLAMTSTSYWQVRNAADVWLRYILRAFEINSQHVTFVMIGLVIGALVWIKTRNPEAHFRPMHGVFILLESFAYSLVLGMLVNLLLQYVWLSALAGQGTLQKLALSIGAGLFEEFVFRVVLLNLLFAALLPVLRSTVVTAVVAISSASFFFALAHYVGNMGEPFELDSFMFRWVAGLVFTVLYFVRGFAVTAYTHAFYDVHVLL